MATVLLAATQSPAQRDPAAGLGAQSLEIDLIGVVGEVGNLGLQYLQGELFVSTRSGVPEARQHFVSVFDANGVRNRSWQQPGFAQSSSWGFRDGASDGENLMFGYEFGIQIVDKQGVIVESLSTANGPHQVAGGLISGNVLQPDNAGITRALAYDSRGDGGAGSFWTGSFASSVFEIDVAGDVLRSYPNSGESSYGFAIDPVGNGDRMWINSVPNAGVLAEYDLLAGQLTGKQLADLSDDGIQGGLDIIPGSFGRGPKASGYDLAYIRQGPDFLRVRRLHLDVAGEGIPASPVTRLGTAEPDLLSSLDDERFFPRSDRGEWVFDNNSSALNLFFDISRNPGDGLGMGGLNGRPAVIFANIGVDAARGLNAISNGLGIRELSHLQSAVTLPEPQLAVRSRSMILSNNPLTPDANAWRIDLRSLPALVDLGDCLRFQGLWLDDDVAFLPVALSNQVRFCRGPDQPFLSGTYVEAFGGNSYNADTSMGFFRVINEENDPARSVVRLRFTVRPGTPSATTEALFERFFRWDTDQEGMAEDFRGGNSLLSGCLGTYRNGSEIQTGLIYAGTPQADCDPAATQGWQGFDDGTTVYGSFAWDYLTLEFRFNPDTFMAGRIFEFDADTDGGTGLGGADMAGVVVFAEFRDGSVTRGELVADLINGLRSSAQL
ncbi:MAG: hypothetical protein ACYTG5_15875 [Planctomycetota bacterium]